MTIFNEKFIERKEDGVNICILTTDLGCFKGVVRCKEEDMNNYSSLLGGNLAHILAMKKYAVKGRKKFIEHLAKARERKDYYFTEDECLEQIEKYTQLANKMILSFDLSVKNFFEGKKTLQRYKIAKANNEPFTMTERLQEQVKNLQNLKEEIEKNTIKQSNLEKEC